MWSHKSDRKIKGNKAADLGYAINTQMKQVATVGVATEACVDPTSFRLVRGDFHYEGSCWFHPLSLPLSLPQPTTLSSLLGTVWLAQLKHLLVAAVCSKCVMSHLFQLHPNETWRNSRVASLR